MAVNETPGLQEFLRDYPLMAIRPSKEGTLLLRGRFDFIARHAKEGEVRDSFTISIDIPKNFPKEAPKVIELDHRIPRIADFHVNSDGSFCLGSPLGLLHKLSKRPTLIGFAEDCLVPYLFAISRKLKLGGPLPFGELSHGVEGMFADYIELFGLKCQKQAYIALHLLGKKKRIANKFPCPCRCGKRLGCCSFNTRIKTIRAITTRSWFIGQWNTLYRLRQNRAAGFDF